MSRSVRSREVPALRLALTAAVLICGTGLTTPAQATPVDTRALVLSGSTSVQATFTLARQRNMRDLPLELTGGRTYVAADLRHQDQAHGAQAAVVRVFGREHAEHVRDGGDATMPAGRYTLTLLSDGPATVTLHFPSGRAPERLQATRQIDSSLRTGSAPLAQPTGAARVVLPGAVPAGRSAFLLSFMDADVRLGRFERCATAGRSCEGSTLVPEYAAGPVTNPLLRRVSPTSTTRNAVTAVDGIRNSTDRLRAAVITYG